MEGNAIRNQSEQVAEEQSEAAPMDSAAAEEDSKRFRSTIEFPYSDLNEAIKVASTVYDSAGGQCGLDQLASWLGHDSMRSGTFRMKLSAARLCGFVEVNRDEVQLTPLGHQVIDPTHEREARVRGFLNVPLYRRLYDMFKGRQLPPDTGLEQTIVKLGVSPKQRDKARQVFQRSADQAGLFNQGRSRLVLPAGIRDTPGDPTLNGSSTPPPSTANGVGSATSGRQEEQNGASGGTHHQSGQGSNSGRHEGVKPILIEGLFQRLPADGAEWPEEERQAWMDAAQSIFNLVYKKPGHS